MSTGHTSSPPPPSGSLLDPAKCVVLVPVGHHVEPACEAGLRELERRGYPVRRIRGYSAIDQGRNQMATDALADGFDETMWVDSDIGFEPDAVEQLRSHNLPIVCGVYPQKQRRVLAIHVLPGTEKVVFGEEGGLLEIMYTGAGFLLVRRSVYEKLQQELDLPVCNEHFGRPMVPFFQPLVRSDLNVRWYLSEDFAFCERARRCGFRIVADTAIRLHHFGTYGYTWEDAGSPRARFLTYNFHVAKRSGESVS